MNDVVETVYNVDKGVAASKFAEDALNAFLALYPPKLKEDDDELKKRQGYIQEAGETVKKLAALYVENPEETARLYEQALEEARRDKLIDDKAREAAKVAERGKSDAVGLERMAEHVGELGVAEAQILSAILVKIPGGKTLGGILGHLANMETTLFAVTKKQQVFKALSAGILRLNKELEARGIHVTGAKLQGAGAKAAAAIGGALKDAGLDRTAAGAIDRATAIAGTVADRLGRTRS